MAHVATMDRVKAAKKTVAEKFRSHGLDAYVHVVDAKGRVVVRTKDEFWDIQVKSMNGYNHLIGLDHEEIASSKNYILIVNYHFIYRDEYMYLVQEQALEHAPKGTEFGDLYLRKAQRLFYYEEKGQTLDDLADRMTARSFRRYIASPPMYKDK